MKKIKKATSIIEAIIMILIITIGVIGLFNIYNASLKVSNSTKNKIQAIEIAREGIEAMENIRNTNWQILGADKDNCWNALNYNNNCIGDNSTNYDISSGMYKIYNQNGRWKLSKASSLTTKNYKDKNYRNFFKVNLDSNGFYTQSGGIDFKPIFTREINISYPEDTNSDGSQDSNDEKMNIHSIVMWADGFGTGSTHIVDLEGMLTNWKKD